MNNSEQKFVEICSQFFNGVIAKCGSYLADQNNLETLRGKQAHEITNILRQVSDLPAQQVQPLMGQFPMPTGPTQFGPPSLPAPGTFAPAFAGIPAGNPALANMMPLGLGGIVQQPPPSDKKSKPRKEAPHLWFEPSYYKANCYGKQGVCAYMPARGDHKGKVCCNPSINHQSDQNPLNWRCGDCANKTGNIAREFGKIIANAAPINGFNVPGQTPVQPQLGFGVPQQGSNTFAVQIPAQQSSMLPTGINGFGGGTTPSFSLPASLPPAGQQFGLPSSLPQSQFSVPTSQPPIQFPLPTSGFSAVSSFPGLPTSLPGLPTSLPNFSGFPPPSMQSLPPSLPNAAFSLPGLASSIPQPLPTASVPQVDVFSVKGIQGVFVLRGIPTPNLIVLPTNEGNVCIGRVELGGTVIDQNTDLPANWRSPEYLKDISDSDKEFLSGQNITYSYQTESPQSV